MTPRVDVLPTAGPSPAVVPADAATREHLDYLQSLAARRVVSPELARLAADLWALLSRVTGGRVPVPAAAAVAGGPVEYHWTVGPHRLSAEIPAGGPCHWFYKHVESGEVWGGEAPADALPPALRPFLDRVAAGDRT